MKIMTICPYCEVTRRYLKVDGPRGPDRAWVRLYCEDCDDGFEYQLTDGEQKRLRRERERPSR